MCWSLRIILVNIICVWGGGGYMDDKKLLLKRTNSSNTLCFSYLNNLYFNHILWSYHQFYFVWQFSAIVNTALYSIIVSYISSFFTMIFPFFSIMYLQLFLVYLLCFCSEAIFSMETFIVAKNYIFILVRVCVPMYVLVVCYKDTILFGWKIFEFIYYFSTTASYIFHIL